MFGLNGANPVMVDIDTPSPSAIVAGQFAINGWAIGGNGPIQSVTLSLDGAVLGQASYGSSRGDVLAAYPGNPDGSNCGWTSLLSTLNLSNGSHSLTATAVDSTGATNTTTQQFTVANNGASSTVLTPSSTPINTPLQVGTAISAPPTSSTSLLPILLIAGGGLLLLSVFGGFNEK